MRSAFGKKIKRSVTAGMATAFLSTLLVVLQPSPALAGTCTTAGCGGKVNNQSSSHVYVTNCWHDLSGSWAGAVPPCATNGFTKTQYKAWYGLSAGGLSTTELGVKYYDVDAFMARSGCVTSGYFSGPSSFSFDRRGKSDLWTRVTGTSTAFITSVVC